VDTSKRVLGFQCAPQSEGNYAEIAKQITQYSQQSGCEVALVPIGYCHDDDKALKRLSAVSNGAFKYVGVRSVEDMLSALAACDMFLGTSMHANITAFSFGIPHLVGPLPYDKMGGFIDITGLDPALYLNTWSEAADRLKWVEELGAGYFEERAVSAKRSVHKTFDQLVQAIKP
jgi:polysaccharide pyruvyl transferase WcaK-like protein